MTLMRTLVVTSIRKHITPPLRENEYRFSPPLQPSWRAASPAQHSYVYIYFVHVLLYNPVKSCVVLILKRLSHQTAIRTGYPRQHPSRGIQNSWRHYAEKNLFPHSRVQHRTLCAIRPGSNFRPRTWHLGPKLSRARREISGANPSEQRQEVFRKTTTKAWAYADRGTSGLSLFSKELMKC